VKGLELDEYETCGQRCNEGYHGGCYGDPEREHVNSSTRSAAGEQRFPRCTVPCHFLWRLNLRWVSIRGTEIAGPAHGREMPGGVMFQAAFAAELP
jgi:hypothetical protein